MSDGEISNKQTIKSTSSSPAIPRNGEKETQMDNWIYQEKRQKHISQPVSQSSSGEPYSLQKLKKDFVYIFKTNPNLFSFSYNFPSLMRSFEVWREMQTDFVFLIFNQKSLTRLVMVMMLMVVLMMVVMMVKFKPIVFLIFKRNNLQSIYEHFQKL